MSRYEGKRFKRHETGPRPYGASAPAHYRAAAKPRRRRRNILPVFLIVIGIMLIAAAGLILIKALMGYREASASYDEVREYAQVSDKDGLGIPDVDFDELAKINPDVVGWIYVKGTNISYPVVQGEDNTYYLKELFAGGYNNAGSIFLDADDEAPGMVDQQTTIYGHHMNDNSMFTEIDAATNQDKFDQIGEAFYITRDAVYRCTPLMASAVDKSYVEARRPNFSDGASLQDYLNDALAKAGSTADDAKERIAEADQVLTLVTCNWQIGWVGGDVRSLMIFTVDEKISI